MPFYFLRKPLRNATFLWLLAQSASLSAAPISHKLAVGVPFTGIQVHWGFSQKWAVEVRELKGKESTDVGDIKSDVFGLRLYHYFHEPARLRFFWGLEVASTSSTAQDFDYKTSGTAVGAFLGTELYLLKRISVGIDAGPYVISSKIKSSSTSASETDMVVNTFMNFYFL